MRTLIAVLIFIAVGATALVVAGADARPTAGTYVGTTSEGRNITVIVTGKAVRSVEAHVLCGGSPSSVQATDGGRIRGRRFSFDEDHLLSGAGSDEEVIHLDGRFHGTVLSGWVEYARSWRCQGRAHYRANLVRTP